MALKEYIDHFHNTTNREKIVIAANNFGNTATVRRNSVYHTNYSMDDRVSRGRGLGCIFMSNIEQFGQATVSKIMHMNTNYSNYV